MPPKSTDTAPPAATEAAAAVPAGHAPPAATPAQRPLAGIGLIILSTLLFSGGDVAAKLMTNKLPALEITWFRYLYFAGLVVPLVYLAHGRAGFATTRPGLQVFRAVCVILSSILFILGLEHLQPAEATAINFISPLFITALSIPLLGERVGMHRWVATGVGFIGVLILVRPGTSAFQLAALFPVGTAITWAFATITARMMSAERPEATLAWTALVGGLGLSLVVIPGWKMPDAEDFRLGAYSGVLSSCGHWCVIKAYRLAPASVIAPFSYTQLMFAGVMGYFAFGVFPGPWTWAGSLVIAASGLYTARRDSAAR